MGVAESYGSIKPISLYGLAYLGKSISICQPAALAYRSATLYGATEQAVGGAIGVAGLSVASIIGPQVSQPRATSIPILNKYSHTPPNRSSRTPTRPGTSPVSPRRSARYP